MEYEIKNHGNKIKMLFVIIRRKFSNIEQFLLEDLEIIWSKPKLKVDSITSWCPRPCSAKDGSSWDCQGNLFPSDFFSLYLIRISFLILSLCSLIICCVPSLASHSAEGKRFPTLQTISSSLKKALFYHHLIYHEFQIPGSRGETPLETITRQSRGNTRKI